MESESKSAKLQRQEAVRGAIKWMFNTYGLAQLDAKSLQVLFKAELALDELFQAADKSAGVVAGSAFKDRKP